MSPEEKKNKIREFDRNGLIHLWENVVEPRKENQGKSKWSWEFDDAFRYLILRAFELEGVEISYPIEYYSVQHNNSVYYTGALYTKFFSSLLFDRIVDANKTGQIGFKNFRKDEFKKVENSIGNRPNLVAANVFSATGYAESLRDRFNAWYEGENNTKNFVLVWTGEEIKYALYNGKFMDSASIKYKVAVESLMIDFDTRVFDLS